MDLSLNETQLMLQTMAREFAEAELSPRVVRAIDESETGYSAELWGKIAELGFAGMLVREAHGGTENSLTDLAVVFEALGYAACPSPLLAQVLCADLVGAIATPEQQSMLLPALASGVRLTAFAMTEADYGWGAADVQMTGALAGDSVMLAGEKSFVPYAEVADDLLVLVRTSGEDERGLTLARVARDAAGVTTRRQRGWLGEPVCVVTFDGVQADVLGQAGDAWPGVSAALDRATALLSATMLGGSQAALDTAIGYSKTRMAFGQAIGTFQRVQDLIIRALNDTDAIRWTTYEALWKLDEGRDDAALAVSTAKAVANEGFQQSAENAIYVHAGAGMDLDYGLTTHVKRSKFYGHYLGDAIHHKLRMARLLGLEPGEAEATS
jgi:alkylation response protein AidB-like acyl-CoA dehydrogenase